MEPWPGQTRISEVLSKPCRENAPDLSSNHFSDERKGAGHLEHWPGKTRISDALSKLYWKTKQDPIQEDLLRKTAVPKAQLQMTNPNTHHMIIDFQTKHKPIQEDSLRNEAGPSAQLQMTNSRTHHKILNFQIKQTPIQEDPFKNSW